MGKLVVEGLPPRQPLLPLVMPPILQAPFHRKELKTNLAALNSANSRLMRSLLESAQLAQGRA